MTINSFNVRRVVTGFDAEGKSIIETDSPSPHVTLVNESGSLAVADLWVTGAAPSPARAPDALTRAADLVPLSGGSVLRVIRFPPDKELEGISVGPRPNDEGAARAFADQDTSIHPLMHKTMTIDYAIVLSGEIWAILEKGETLMRAGDVLIQRATSHAWANRSDSPSVVAFVLIDAEDR
ncbi:MAG TPA: cupin domain-containing protein [Allosphingosinicella sp.]|nr:cupin domain-containing protein [Allosphingosinicella sp.]